MKDSELIQRKYKRMFQRIKNMTNEQFVTCMEVTFKTAYDLGRNNVFEAMSCHPRIYKPMIEQTRQKAEQIREEWDGLFQRDMDVNEVEDAVKLFLARGDLNNG